MIMSVTVTSCMEATIIQVKTSSRVFNVLWSCFQQTIFKELSFENLPPSRNCHKITHIHNFLIKLGLFLFSGLSYWFEKQAINLRVVFMQVHCNPDSNLRDRKHTQRERNDLTWITNHSNCSCNWKIDYTTLPWVGLEDGAIAERQCH